MHVIDVRNTGEALPRVVDYLVTHGVAEDSRAGRVLVAPGPVVTVTRRPRERVLFSPVRDANPFFHVAEAVLWLLAGRRDAAFLNNFVRDFGERFAEPDGTIHGAYGHRWRAAFGFDQLDAVVERLRADPASRQCVVQMWDARLPTETNYDPNSGGSGETVGEEDLTGSSWRDRPCNVAVFLRVRQEHYERGMDQDQPVGKVLDLTVLCRSNDMVWGGAGANSVQFSVLQEYLAARIGVGVGVMYQFSNNAHIYVSELDRLTARANQRENRRPADGWSLSVNLYSGDCYERGTVAPEPLVDDPATFDSEMRWVLNTYESLGEGPPDGSAHALIGQMRNRFLSTTVWPMLMAHRNWRRKNHNEALRWCSMARATDWRKAATEWVQRRTKP
jgi:thymidylate synthase